MHHVVEVGLDLVVQRLWGVGEQIAFLVPGGAVEKPGLS
jgi:hypothetical protein